jgi:hypothetical protein
MAQGQASYEYTGLPFADSNFAKFSILTGTVTMAIHSTDAKGPRTTPQQGPYIRESGKGFWLHLVLECAKFH